jgi:hypothetical protein
MAVIRVLTTALRANTAQFRRGMLRARRSLDKFRKVVFSVRGALVLLGAGTVIHRIRALSMEFDAIGKTADKLGIAAEELQVLQRAAVLSGNSVRNLNLGLQRMTRRISEAAIGTGEAQGAIKELGLDAQELARMSPDKQFLAIADAMAKVSTQNDKVRLGFKLFDSEGVGLVNTLGKGRKELEKIADAMRATGQLVSAENIDKLESMNDAWTELGGSLKAIGANATAAAAPALEGLAKHLQDMANWLGTVNAETKVLQQMAKDIRNQRPPWAKPPYAGMFSEERFDVDGYLRRRTTPNIVPIPQAMQDAALNVDLASRFKEQESFKEMADLIREFPAAFSGTGSVAEGIEETTEAGEEFAVVITSAFNDALFSAQSFSEVLGAIAQQIASIALNKAIFAPIGNALGAGLQGFMPNWESIGRGLLGSSDATSAIGIGAEGATNMFVPAVT